MTYVRFGSELEDDVVPLCQQCHNLFHQENRYDHDDMFASTRAFIASRAGVTSITI